MIDVALRAKQIRDIEMHMKQMKDAYEESLKPYIELSMKLRAEVHKFLLATNQKNAKTVNGTAYLLDSISYRIDDQDTFKRHIIGSEAWDCINWSVNKSAADDLFVREQQLMPGTTRSVNTELRVLAPPKPRAKKPTLESKANGGDLTQEDWDEINAAIDLEATTRAEA